MTGRSACVQRAGGTFNAIMRPTLVLLSFLALVPFVPQQVAAATDCRLAAARAAQQFGGRVLSARPVGASSCEVTLLVPQAGGPPRRIVTTVTASNGLDDPFQAASVIA